MKNAIKSSAFIWRDDEESAAFVCSAAVILLDFVLAVITTIPAPPVSKLSASSAGSEVALSAVSLVNYNLSGITTLGFTTSAGFEP